VPILPILIVLYGLKTLASVAIRGAWPMELVQHFRPHMIVAGVVGAALCLLLGERWEWAAISAGLALVNYAAMPEPRWVKAEAHLSGAPGLTVVWANVWHKQTALERTLAWAQAQNADVILVGEYPDTDSAGVLPGDYPHRLDPGVLPDRKYARRVVAFSRLPINDGQILQGPGPRIRPFVKFKVDVDGRPLGIIGAHPVPPTSPKLLKERDSHIGGLAAQATEPFVIAGDFNATPWCPAFTAIPGRRVGAYAFKPTWAFSLPLLGLPIDHIMVSAAMKVSGYVVAPFTGSDHRAILARVHLPSRTAP
jgi:endonuclease/exonuclease/phosphatase (EEP) superfamily protein YafD